jgi:hypothetical protein
MSQGIKNRKVGEVFIDQENNDEYILSELRIFSGKDYDELINNINAVFNIYKIVNRKDVTPNTKRKIKTAIYVELVNREKKLKYPIVRLFDKEFSVLSDAPAWSGTALLEDYNRAYSIRPRLRVALGSQSAYQASRIDFASLLSNSQNVVGNTYGNVQGMLDALINMAEADKSDLGKAILELLNMVSKGEFGTIKGAARFDREISIYASEFIVPLAIALGTSTPVISDAIGGDTKINTRSNHMGFDAVIQGRNSKYLISVKQGGAGRKHGAYSSIAYLQKIIADAEKEGKLNQNPLFKNLEKYKQILNLILGIRLETQKLEDPNEAELESVFAAKFTRKTYRNLFLLAKAIEVPNAEISKVLQFVGNENNPLDKKIAMLNIFAKLIYMTLNKQDWFKDTTKALLKFNNFLQASLMTRRVKDDLEILGVYVDNIDQKEVDISAEKSYFGSKYATGHGGFLLLEILELEQE